MKITCKGINGTFKLGGYNCDDKQTDSANIESVNDVDVTFTVDEYSVEFEPKEFPEVISICKDMVKDAIYASKDARADRIRQRELDIELEKEMQETARVKANS